MSALRWHRPPGTAHSHRFRRRPMVGTADGYSREAERAQAERLQAERLQAERLREFIVLKKEARRPQLPVIMWRWRYETAALLLIPALLIFLLMILGPWWTVADI